MSQSSDSFKASKKQSKARTLFALGLIAGVAIYNKDTVADNLGLSNNVPTDEIEYDLQNLAADAVI